MSPRHLPAGRRGRPGAAPAGEPPEGLLAPSRAGKLNCDINWPAIVLVENRVRQSESREPDIEPAGV